MAAIASAGSIFFMVRWIVSGIGFAGDRALCLLQANRADKCAPGHRLFAAPADCVV